MFKHILLPVDGSELSNKAVSGAIEFARETGARITPYICHEEFHPPITMNVRLSAEHFVSGREKEARDVLSRIEAAAATVGVPCKGETSVAAAPYLGIIAKAQELGCDIIFMASHGRGGISSLLLGSETQKVLAHSKVPVLVFR